jgi:hypothetical protein
MSSPSSQTALSASLKGVLAEQLEPDEHVLWTAAPQPRRAANRKSLPAVAGVVLCVCAVFAVFFGSGRFAVPSTSWLSAALWAYFFFFGLGLIAAPFRGAWRARRTLYALTNRRAFVIVLGRQINIQTFKTFRLGHVETVLKDAGGGDLIFGRALQYAPGGPRYELEVGFYDLEGVNAALAALKASHSKPAPAAVATSDEP